MKKVSIAAIIIMILLNLIIIANVLSNHSTSFMDEKLIYLSTSHLFNTGNLGIDNSFNKNLSTCIFSSQLVSSDFKGHSFFSVYSLTPIFFLPFRIVFGDYFQTAVTYLFSSINIILMYLISRRLFKKDAIPVIITLFFILFPVFTKFEISFFNIVPSLSFFLLSIYYLFFSDSKYKYTLSGIYFSIILFLRPQEVLFTIPFLLIIWLNDKKIKSLLKFITPIIIYCIIALIINYFIYKNSLFVSPAYAQNFPCLQLETIKYYSKNGLVDSFKYLVFGADRLKSIFENLYFLFKFKFAYPLIIPAVLSFALFFKKNKKLAIFSGMLLLITLLLYGRYTGSYYGYSTEDLNSSFFRYFFYIYIMLTLYLGYLLDKIVYNQKKIISFFIITLLFFSLAYTIYYQPNGFLDYNKTRNSNYDNSNKLYNYTTNNTILILDFYTAQLIKNEQNNVIDLNKIYIDSRAENNTVDLELLKVINLALEKNISILYTGKLGQNEAFENNIRSNYAIENVTIFQNYYSSFFIKNRLS